MGVNIVLGIDPGAQGAIALLDEGGALIEIRDMPNTPDGKKLHVTNAPLLSEILAKSHAKIIYCEFVGPQPTDSRMSAFSFGRARGVVEGCAAALGIPIIFLTPQTWKRFANVPGGGTTSAEKYANKQIARTRAIAKWPDKAGFFELATRVDRAEAALIGACGLAFGMVQPPLQRATKRTKADLLDELAERSAAEVVNGRS